MAEDAQSRFVRQRRSLILISAVLTIALVFGLKGSEVRMAPGSGSVTVDFRNPAVIVYGLWIMWGWFFYRYWQTFLEVRGAARARLHKLQNGPIEDAFKSRLIKLLKNNAENKIRETHEKATNIATPQVGFIEGPRRDGHTKVVATAKVKVVAAGQDGAVTNLGGHQTKAELSGLLTYLKLLRVVLPINLKHNYFTEYWTAFAFSAAPLVALVQTFLSE